MTYWVINVVRRVQTRTKRALSPTRHRFKQYIFNGTVRLVRNRPVPIREEQLEQYRDELWGLQEQGIIEVRVGTQDGPVYGFGEKAEEPVEEPEAVEEEVEVELDEEEVEEEEVEVEEEELDEGEEEKPLVRMNKKELQEKYEAVLGQPPDQNLTKRELIAELERGQ